jgi:hypothetical protein
MNRHALFGFDAGALYEALDEQRRARGLSWAGATREIWELSADLNARRADHPISPATIQNLAKRGASSCQHALFMLRWLGRTPESFLVGGAASAGAALPEARADQRLRWNLAKLHEALNATRRERGLTWAQTAREIGCQSSQLTGLRTAKFATNMDLAMRIVQWLERSSSDFIYAASW